MASGAVAAEQRLDDIVDVDAISSLRTVSEDADLLAQQRLADEDGQEAQLVAGQSLARPVDVGQSQAGRRHGVRRVVHQVELLAGQLRDAVDVHRAGRMQLVDR